MPLKVDSLLTNSIVLNGTQLSGNQTLFPGKINVDNDYLTIGSSETIVDTFLLKADSVKGIGFPSYLVYLDCDNSSYSDLILKFYVSEINSIVGQTPIYQGTWNDIKSPSFSSGFYLGGDTSPGIGDAALLEFVGKEIYAVIGNQMFENPPLSTVVFDNFDVSKDLYLIVTAEKIGSTLGVKSLSIAIFPFK